MISQLAAWLEILGGSRPLPEVYKTRRDLAIARGLVWVVFLLLAIAFAGRTTKFVYVDF